MAEKQPSDDGRSARAGIGISDDEILDRAVTRDRMIWRMVWVLVSGIALVLAAVATAIFSGHAALVTGIWGQVLIAAVLAVLFVYAFATIGKYTVETTGRYAIQPANADSARLVHRRMDFYQRRWRRLILFNVFALFIAVNGMARAIPFLRAAPPLLLWAGIAIAGIVLVSAFILSVGPGWQSMLMQPGARGLPGDEFESALRARMMRFGYILMLLLLGAVFLIALWRPDLTPAALAWVLYAGFAVPALYYVIADWWASRGGES